MAFEMVFLTPFQTDDTVLEMPFKTLETVFRILFQILETVEPMLDKILDMVDWIAVQTEKTTELMADSKFAMVFLIPVQAVVMYWAMKFKANEIRDFIPSQAVARTCLMVSYAPVQSPVITCMTALMIPSTTLMAVSTTIFIISQAVVMISLIFSQLAWMSGPRIVITV